MNGWPYLYSYHVLACFDGDPATLSENDARRVLRRMPPMCLVTLVMEAARAPRERRAA